MATTTSAAVSLPTTRTTTRGAARRPSAATTTSTRVVGSHRPRGDRRPAGRGHVCRAVSADVDTAPSSSSSSAQAPQIQSGELEVPEWHYRDLIDDRRVFRETFPVRFDEVGPDKTATMNTVAAMVGSASSSSGPTTDEVSSARRPRSNPAPAARAARTDHRRRRYLMDAPS